MNALHGGYSWVITYEPSLPEWSDSDLKWSDSELAMWIGYTATYVRTGDPSRPEIVMDADLWDASGLQGYVHSIRTAQ